MWNALCRWYLAVGNSFKFKDQIAKDLLYRVIHRDTGERISSMSHVVTGHGTIHEVQALNSLFSIHVGVYKTAWATSNYCVCVFLFFGRICILSTFISWNSSSTWVYLYSSLDRIMWSARDWANPTSYAWEPGGFTEILCCRIRCFSH